MGKDHPEVVRRRRAGSSTRASTATGRCSAPGASIWTAEYADELHAAYVVRPDASGAEFFDKLTKQLADVSDDAKQLFAELFLLNLLPLASYHGPTKRTLVETVLSWCNRKVDIPGRTCSPPWSLASSMAG